MPGHHDPAAPAAATVPAGAAHAARLVVIWHSRTGATRALVDALRDGATSEPGVMTCMLAVGEANPADLLEADLVVLAAPENLGALSGAMKEYLDTGYYDWLDRTNGKPWASIIAAGSDGTGAQRQLDRIATGLRLRRVAEPLIVITDAQSPERIRAAKIVPDADLDRARELGAALAAGLALGIY